MQGKEKDIELRSEEVQDVMGQVPSSIQKWGITVISLVVFFLLIGSFYFKYPDVLKGDVSITTGELDSVVTVCTMLLPAQGSGKVKVGQRANVRITNYPDQEFGYLQGIVESISETPNKDGQYVVEISFPNGLITNYNVQLPSSMHMQGNAEIITEDIRLIVRFFNPIKSMLKKYS